MCRWLAYTGDPIYLDTLITQPDHSLVQQSLNSKLNYNNAGQLLSTNGDGFGIGWYDHRPEPGVFKDDIPAWHDKNLANLCHHIRAHTFMAHVRATTTGDIQRTNCHPFSYKNWLFQHNGQISHFPRLRRELQLSIAPELFPAIHGNTDSETFFLLALTYGLMENPKRALQRMVEEVLKILEREDKDGVLNLSFAISDGLKLYTLRFSHNEAPMTQFYSTDPSCMEEFENDEIPPIPNGCTVVVSEPLDHTDSKWQKIENNCFTTIKQNQVTTETFL
ncbi:class II glutamine amidotransferase [Aliidiomarina sedimenti]|uniref:Class II glutamine amidotransferase n=1 Tax=Aliidiomarina sedimenti TaxID=1933879 RepID=A0ABY0C0C1_9GAMM|nr:class II glutamine amidotransferase [Aliidiomarina sedimenti]RUO30833.1 class II glutamine amidotransferase [Aliidiomarina sedimenti]